MSEIRLLASAVRSAIRELLLSLARAAGVEPPPGAWVELKLVRCGKPGCRKCPHGPYAYMRWYEGGKLRSRYLGRLDELLERPKAARAMEKLKELQALVRSLASPP